MKIKTEIYSDFKGNYWKITREGEDVIIEQAIEPTELIRNETYDQRREAAASPRYDLYDRKGRRVPVLSDSTFSRKV